ncbi:MAG: hypothetical protein CMJ82_09190 [Planctomycetaceae bacterium]|nr:hypothetical protein [Planctomycetaceae bacterium]
MFHMDIIRQILLIAIMTLSSMLVAEDKQVISGTLISTNLATSELVIEDKQERQTVIRVLHSTRIYNGENKTTLITLGSGQELTISVDSSGSAADRIDLRGDRIFPSRKGYPISEWITVQRGTLPILLSAPHGGNESIPGVPKRNDDSQPKFVIKADSNTYPLSKLVAAELETRLGGKPWLVAAKFHRSYIDANRPIEHALEHEKAKATYRAYHLALQHAILEVNCQFESGLLIDLHGQSRLPDVIWRGTRQGTTLGGLTDQFGWDVVEGKNSLMHSFRQMGYSTHPQGIDASESPFSGGFITSTYGYPYGLNSMQLEYGYSFRASKEKYLKTSKDTAVAIEHFYRSYLTKKLKCAPNFSNDEKP